MVCLFFDTRKEIMMKSYIVLEDYTGEEGFQERAHNSAKKKGTIRFCRFFAPGFISKTTCLIFIVEI